MSTTPASSTTDTRDTRVSIDFNKTTSTNSSSSVSSSLLKGTGTTSTATTSTSLADRINTVSASSGASTSLTLRTKTTSEVGVTDDSSTQLTSYQRMQLRYPTLNPAYELLTRLDNRERVKRVSAETARTKDRDVQALANEALGETARQMSKINANDVDFRVLFTKNVREIAKRDWLTEKVETVMAIYMKADKYKIQYKHGLASTKMPIPLSLSSHAKHILSTYQNETTIPKYVLDFDPNKEHTIPLKDYIDTRISSHILTLIEEVNQKGKNTEIFVGPEKELRKFYKASGYRPIAELRTQSSTKYFLLQHAEDPTKMKVVIWGVANASRLNHTLLQLKCAGVDLDKVRIRGNIESAQRYNACLLQKELEKVPSPINLAFMGNRSQILIELAKRLYPKEMNNIPEKQWESTAEKLLKARNNLQTNEIGGVFKYSYVEVEIDGKKQGIIAFRMPNGSLAKYATRALLNVGIQHFVMVGAGGSLTDKSPVGSYQQIVSTAYDTDQIHLPKSELSIMPLKLPEQFPLSKVAGKNITVDSPLVEHQEWLTDAYQNDVTSVDVETYHALDELVHTTSKKPKVFPGLFTSDVLGEHPLSDKIDVANAWKHLPQLISSSFHFVGVPATA